MGRELFENVPELADELGSAFVADLIDRESFHAAAALASVAPPEWRGDWTSSVFEAMSERSGTIPFTELAALTDPELRRRASEAIATGCARSNPEALAYYALMLPAGSERTFALQRAIPSWCERDPSAVAEWLSQLESSDEFDYGSSVLVLNTDQANRSPELALAWSEAITDPSLRMTSVTHAIEELAGTDRSAAERYVESAGWLGPDERTALTRAIEMAGSAQASMSR
jgi:hypothetical protein